MSIECLNQAIKVEGLPPTKKLILILLANYADDQNSCYPSYKHIAKLVGLKTVKGIQKTIKEFEEMGLLRVEHRILENGSYTSNKYYLTLGGGVIKEPTPMNDVRVSWSQSVGDGDAVAAVSAARGARGGTDASAETNQQSVQ